jgi:DNA mismatch repair protein MutH
VWRGRSCPRKANHCADLSLQNKYFRVSLRLFLDIRVAGERHLPQSERATNAGMWSNPSFARG